MELPPKLLSKRDLAAPSSRVLLGAEVTARLAEVRLKDLLELLAAPEALDVVLQFARRVGLAWPWLLVLTPTGGQIGRTLLNWTLLNWLFFFSFFVLTFFV